MATWMQQKNNIQHKAKAGMVSKKMYVLEGWSLDLNGFGFDNALVFVAEIEKKSALHYPHATYREKNWKWQDVQI